ncbi:tRNA (adenosine(37)-N6)-threonylcarbamoyltransferase complex transferase subunit TsaD [Candidatus Uhrbacteria bacterium CG10_big_fil_rev_8_21_14_0_10_48_16]|uniref:tRNA N6-adenosine threonylcarbamoyltransferase n=1 Tax=Candidatus Uhrbacteria bacterium CG10_big_fil_rev_8_21_14_0_10_48_16 TaxID=1975038 RepID=A0A2M8LHY7_9BACT|nr:MAG: tRNA (adenosine(37)-N6)-threonylcarbamoyltransferase complex transferase subunit TsaD [Candidatus Uhrbacteria bacterium CG10_big_fil_rev_8_21_14_0_10_48_16]
MRILAIETSCDETAVAIVSMMDGVFTIEKSILSSQAKIHALYGGVVPEVAAREHAAWIFPLMKDVGVSPEGEGIDAIAVTAGPGLVPALRIGVELGKTLAWAWNKPLVAVNHLEGHIYSVWLNTEKPPSFPALSLLVSGGHTEFILMKDHGDYTLLGMTRDDAVGEAFDKVAKMLGLPYPGGPQISREALEGDATAISFPRPMLDSQDLDLSFSGLKTAVRVYLSEHDDISVADVSASFLQAVVDTLVAKTMRAITQTKPVSVILSGGVSANRVLRETLQSSISQLDAEVTFHAPDLSLSGDNAVMIAVAGLMKASRGEYVDPLTLVADPNMRLA